MKRRTIALFTAALALTGCAAVSDFFADVFSTSSPGPGQVSGLVGNVEKVYVDAELAKTKANAANEALQAIVAPDFSGDGVAAYGSLVKVIEGSEQQTKTLKSSIHAMKRASEPVFRRWTADLEAFTSDEMRARSRARLETARKQFDGVVAASESVLVECNAVNQRLRDYALFLGNDFNAASLAAIRSEAQSLTNLTAQLGVRVDECLSVSKAYVKASALPTAVASDEVEPVEQVQPVSGS